MYFTISFQFWKFFSVKISCKVPVYLAMPNEDDCKFQQKKSLVSIKGSDVMSRRIDSCLLSLQ